MTINNPIQPSKEVPDYCFDKHEAQKLVTAIKKYYKDNYNKAVNVWLEKVNSETSFSKTLWTVQSDLNFKC